MSFSDCYYIKAEEFCVKVTDGTHDSPKRKTEGKFLITSKHIKSREIDFESAYLIDGIDFDKINQRSQVNQWDVLISMIGEYCGFVYVERNFKIDYAVKNVGIFKTGEKEKAEWIYYYLSSPEGKNKLNTLRSGTSQPYISLGALRKLPILQFKNKNIMTGIIKILTKIDEKIHVNYQINKTLENMAQAIFKQWFVDFEFPNEDGEPYKSSGGEMVETELGMIPKGWEVVKLNSVVDICYGKNLPTKKLLSDGYPVFGGNGQIGFYSEYLYEKSQVLIACRGAASGKVIVSLPYSFVTNNSLILEQNGTTVTHEYLKQFCLEKEFYNYATGSAQPQITIANLANANILIPHRDLMNMFSLIRNSIDSKVLSLFNENNKLVAIRDALLPKLMSGEIRVPLDKEGDAS